MLSENDGWLCLGSVPSRPASGNAVLRSLAPCLSGTGVSRDVSSRKMVQAMPCLVLATADHLSRCFLTMHFALELSSSGGAGGRANWDFSWQRLPPIGAGAGTWESIHIEVRSPEWNVLYFCADTTALVEPLFPSSSPSLTIERCRGLDIRHGDRRSPVYLGRADIEWTVPGKTIHP
jgi:hypothetical protein